MNFSDFPMYFLGANSCEGFISRFKESYSCADKDTAYIIKGGPGTGKSSLMKLIAVRKAAENKTVELFPCSSDPDSLDGIRIVDDNIIFLDGTAPHVIEPEYPGICEQIIDPGRFWDREKLNRHRAQLIRLMAANKAQHACAARYIAAAGRLIQDNMTIQQSCISREKLDIFCNALIRRYLPAGHGKGKICERFLSGITPKGIVFYSSTLQKTAKRRVIISDKYGAVAAAVMEKLVCAAISRGYDITVIRSAFFPGSVIDHIIIPQLSLAFCSENDYMHIKTDERRIHSRRFEDNELKSYRARLRFNCKAARELLLSACGALARAKALHDDIEGFYIDAMDFEKMNGYIRRILAQLP